jgi:hypothetical protein
MADNFNLRSFLSENKLTKNARLLNERDTNRPGTDFDFIQGPEQDPLVAKVLQYLEQTYQEGVDFEYDSNMQRLVIYGDLVEDSTLVDLIDDVVTQPEYDEEESLDEASFSDSYDTPASKAVDRQITSIVNIFKKSGQEEREELDAAIAAAEQETGTQVTPAERNTLHRHLRWIRTYSMEMEREGVENEEPVMEAEEEVVAEVKLTAKEQALVEMVQAALGMAPQAVAEEAPIAEELPIAEEIPMAEDEMVKENPLPKYKTIDELMSNIEHGTNEAAHKYKMERMKEVAEALEAKVTSLEEGENAEHIDQKAVKQMRKDILALRKAEEKLRKEFEKKFASKKEAKEEK